ncbi:hypothetical protein ACEZDB_34640 [Streptacidiphilus sp. N1-3]|uniref:Lipoprotein n=1 Tax=Streptacidiphilus alkalitolerans TaxID=3342712 RepID=A0ABV6XBY3_9ACTN
MTHRSSTTRRLAALAVLGVVALGGTNACASGSATTSAGGSSSGSPSAGASTGGTVPSLVPLPTEIPPTTPPSTAPVGGGASAPATPSGIKAENYTTVNTTLTVNFYAGVCATYSLRADQSSTPGEVKVTVLARPKTAKGQMCPQLVQLQSVSANLGSPLDQRTVVDTVSGKAVPLAHTIPGGTKMTHGPVHN